MYKNIFSYFYRFRRHMLDTDHSNLASVSQSSRHDLPERNKPCLVPISSHKRVSEALSPLANFKLSGSRRLRKPLCPKNCMELQEVSKNSIRCSTKHSVEAREQEKGFFTVMGMGLLLLLLLMSGAVVSIGLIAHKKMRLSSHCVHSVLTLQKELKRPLSKLLKMNKKAKALRFQRKVALARLAAATASGIVPAIAAAKAQLFLVTKKQLIFKGKQQLLFFEALALREKFKYKPISSNISRKVHFKHESSSLALAPYPPLSLSPSYKTVNDFFENQGQSYAIKHELSVPRLSLFKFLTKTGHWIIKTQCSASLKRNGVNQWVPSLKKVKESWRSSYGSF